MKAFDRIRKHAKDTARAERAEARVAELERNLKDWQDSSEAYRLDAERAEAECKRLREALEQILLLSNTTSFVRMVEIWDKARAALDPSPEAPEA